MVLRPFTPPGEFLSQSHHIIFLLSINCSKDVKPAWQLMRELDVPKPKCCELHVVHAMLPIHSYSSVVKSFRASVLL